jgi:hypothetical protein
MSMKSKFALAALALAAAGSAFADPIPYPGGGQNLTQYSFTATASGPISAYFLGSGASYDESLGLLVNGTQVGPVGLDNHSTPYGTELTFGNVSAGDSLVFFINVVDTSETYYSQQSLNDDGANHIYSASYTGDAANGVPAGTYVGFEDLPARGADWNYTDEQFAFTNVSSAPAVPEPANAALLMAGLGLMGFVARRRRNK